MSTACKCYGSSKLKFGVKMFTGLFTKKCPVHHRQAQTFLKFSVHLQSQLAVLLLATQSCCFPEGLRANIQQMVCLPQHCCPNDQKCPQSQLFISLATLQCSRAEKRGRKKKIQAEHTRKKERIKKKKIPNLLCQRTDILINR